MAAEVLPATPPDILTGPETDLLPETPPPSYEDVSFGPNGASNTGAVAGTPRSQDTRILRILNETIAQADYKLERLKQLDDSIDIVYISSRIRQLCHFIACRVAEDCQRHRKQNGNLKERRETTDSEIRRLFWWIVTKVNWKRQDGISVVRLATTASRETGLQILVGNEHRNYWQARAGYNLMASTVFRTAGQVIELKAGDKDLAQTFVAVAERGHKAAKSCVGVDYPADKPLFIDAQDPGRCLNYAQSRSLVRKLVRGFIASGLGKGDTVLPSVANNYLCATLLDGVIGAGGIACGVNPAWKVEELNHVLRQSEAEFSITTPDSLPTVLKVADVREIPTDRIFVLEDLDAPLDIITNNHFQGPGRWPR
ncbi:hypothetical protein PG996_014133 [Apiospora saccharicola]|uniref:AMP-dependent synthetase/ligase domain-containing protein n=1 Tax=Apiospora saccharicola TaxID=335842 RepID=A0ABR1TK45_9PEZI